MSSPDYDKPPYFKKGDNYQKWKKRIRIWQNVTTLEMAKQGSAIFMSLNDDSQDAALDLDDAVINGEDGVDSILKLLDGLHLMGGTKSEIPAPKKLTFQGEHIQMKQEKLASAMDPSKSKLSSFDWMRFWHTEKERTKGDCEVMLWTRPIAPPNKSKPLKFLFSSVASASSLAGLSQFSHWMLVFKWTEHLVDAHDDKIFPKVHSYEAFETEGILIPAWSENGPQGEEWKETSKIGNLRISPNEVNNTARFLWNNEKLYSVLKFNCQVWAKDLWKQLKGKDQKDIPIVGLRTVVSAINPASSLKAKDNSEK